MKHYFITASPKSCSSLLTRLIVQHPHVGCIHESWLTEPNHHSVTNPKGPTPAAHGFTDAQADELAALVEQGDKATAYRRMLWYYSQQHPALKAVGDSWVVCWDNIPMLAETFPDALFIHTVRDPRAVWWSEATFIDPNVGEPRGPVNGDVIISGMMRAWDVFKQLPEGRRMVIPAEALVYDPWHAQRIVWDRLGVDPSLGWREYDADKDPHPGRWHWVRGCTDTPDPRRESRWMTEMTPEQAQRVVDLPGVKEYAEEHRYDLDKQPQAVAAGELIDMWLRGTPVVELVERFPDAENALRREMNAAIGACDAAGAALQCMRSALEAEADACCRAVAPGPLQGQHLTGMGAGLARAEGLIGHVHNVLLWRASVG